MSPRARRHHIFDLELTDDERARYERAQLEGFIIARGDDDQAVIAFARWCKARALPLVLVEPRRQSTMSKLTISLNTAGRVFDAGTSAAVEEAFRAARGWSDLQFARAGSIEGWCPSEDAALLARVLLRLTRRPGPWGAAPRRPTAGARWP